MWGDSLGSAMAALNRAEAAPSAAKADAFEKLVSRMGNSVIPWEVWEERCQLLKKETQPRRRVKLADYCSGAEEENSGQVETLAGNLLEQQGEQAAALSALTVQTPRSLKGGEPPRRKRITEQVLLKARLENAAKTAALSGPGPYEEPFGGPYLPSLDATTPRGVSNQGSPRAYRNHCTRRAPLGRPVDPHELMKDGLTFRGPYKVVTSMANWNKPAERPKRETPREIKSRDPLPGGGREGIRDARLANLEARQRLGEMLQMPESISNSLKGNSDWLMAVPGGSLEVPPGRLNPKDNHPARSTRMQIPQPNLRVI